MWVENLNPNKAIFFDKNKSKLHQQGVPNKCSLARRAHKSLMTFFGTPGVIATDSV